MKTNAVNHNITALSLIWNEGYNIGFEFNLFQKAVDSTSRRFWRLQVVLLLICVQCVSMSMYLPSIALVESSFIESVHNKGATGCTCGISSKIFMYVIQIRFVVWQFDAGPLQLFWASLNPTQRAILFCMTSFSGLNNYLCPHCFISLVLSSHSQLK